jgi:hypothetical protein
VPPAAPAPSSPAICRPPKGKWLAHAPTAPPSYRPSPQLRPLQNEEPGSLSERSGPVVFPQCDPRQQQRPLLAGGLRLPLFSSTRLRRLRAWAAGDVPKKRACVVASSVGEPALRLRCAFLRCTVPAPPTGASLSSVALSRRRGQSSAAWHFARIADTGQTLFLPALVKDRGWPLEFVASFDRLLALEPRDSSRIRPRNVDGDDCRRRACWPRSDAGAVDPAEPADRGPERREARNRVVEEPVPTPG